jgi:hypothetical protein
MRKAIGSAVIGLLLGTTALSGVSSGQALSSAAPPPSPAQDWSLHSTPPPPSPPTRVWVHLNGVHDLEHLRATNFNHYLRARKILAAANEICQPGPAQTFPARFSSDYPSCEGMWLTSYPPKKHLTFHLDDVGYIALVSVTIGGGKLQELDAHAASAR